jgi:hypothetical protein
MWTNATPPCLQKVSRCQALAGFPRDAGKTTGDRGGDDRHPGPHPRLHRARRAQGRQTRLLPETAHPRHPRSPFARPRRRRGAGLRRRHGQPASLVRRHAPGRRLDPRRGHRRGETRDRLVFAQLPPFGNAYWSTLTDRPPAETPPSPTPSIGISGSAMRGRSGRIIPPTTRPAGAPGGTSAAA